VIWTKDGPRLEGNELMDLRKVSGDDPATALRIAEEEMAMRVLRVSEKKDEWKTLRVAYSLFKDGRHMGNLEWREDASGGPNNGEVLSVRWSYPDSWGFPKGRRLEIDQSMRWFKEELERYSKVITGSADRCFDCLLIQEADDAVPVLTSILEDPKGEVHVALFQHEHFCGTHYTVHVHGYKGRWGLGFESLTDGLIFMRSEVKKLKCG